MAGRSTAETKRMLFEGVEMVAKDGAGEVDQEHGPDAVADLEVHPSVPGC